MADSRSARIPASRVLLVACFGAFLAFLDATIVNVAFPSLRESFPTASIGGALVGPERLQHRLRRVPHRLRTADRPAGPPPRVRDRRAALHRRVRALRGGTVRRAARGRPGRAGARRRPARARVARAGRRGLPGRAPGARDRPVGRLGRRGGRRRAAHRRRAGAARRLALGLPGQPPVRRGRAVGLAQPPGREPRAGAASRPRPRRRGPDGRRARAPHPRHRQERGLGLDQPPGRRHAGRRGRALRRLRARRRGGTPHRCSTLPCCACRRSRSAPSPRPSRASGSTPTCSPTSCGCSTSGGTTSCAPDSRCVPAAVVAAVVAARLGPLAERVGYRAFIVPGALVWAGAYLWYHQQVGLEPAFWTEWLPGQLLSGIGVGATLPLLGSAALAAVPGGRYATASAVVSSARQLGGVLGIAVLVVIIGDPTPAVGGRIVAGRLDALDRRLRPDRARRARPAGAPPRVAGGGHGRAPARRRTRSGPRPGSPAVAPAGHRRGQRPLRRPARRRPARRRPQAARGRRASACRCRPARG